MSKDLQVILTEQDVPKENAEALLQAFGAPFEEAGKILAHHKEIEVTSEDQTELMAKAKEQRLALKKIRTGVEAKRKELKENALKTGRAIDGVARFIRDNIEPAEKYLELQEKFAQIQEEKRAVARKAERLETISKYTDSPEMYNLDTMTDQTFDTLVKELKAAHDAKLAEEKRQKEEAERQAKEEEEARKKQAAENERLKREAEERDKAMEAERAEARKKQEAADRKAAEERKKREELEAKQRAEEDQRAKEKAEAEEAERQALIAPDKEKLKSLANALAFICLEKLPAVKSKQAQDLLNEVESDLKAIERKISERAKEL